MENNSNIAHENRLNWHKPIVQKLTIKLDTASSNAGTSPDLLGGDHE